MKFDSAEISAIRTTAQRFPTQLETLHESVAILTKQERSNIQPILVYSRWVPLIDLKAEVWAQPSIYAFVSSIPMRTILYLGHCGITKNRLKPNVSANKLGHELFWKACLLDPKFEVHAFPVSKGVHEHDLISHFDPLFNRTHNGIEGLCKKEIKRKIFLYYVQTHPRCDLSSVTSEIGCSRDEAKIYGEELKHMGRIDFEEGKSKNNGLRWEYWALD